MPSKKTIVITINPLFKLLIIINLSLCAFTLGIMFTIGLRATGDTLPAIQERLFTACEYVFTMTAGAFIGLLGGKASMPDGIREQIFPAPEAPQPAKEVG